jgi:hypothetical protein
MQIPGRTSAAPYITAAAAAQVFLSTALLVARYARRRLGLLSVAKRFATSEDGRMG